MILKIRKSLWSRATSLFLAFVMLVTTFQSAPSYALTGGPAQPEFNAFTPIGTSDMVDLASGDFSYNIPLMDIGGFPINLAYTSGITMDQEASWVGLGWDLSIGQINRQMRGFPDDFDGDEVQYENNVKDNTTVGANFVFNPALFGLDGLPGTIDDPGGPSYSVGLGIEYNTYNGVSIKPSLGLSFSLSGQLSAGINIESSPDGLTVSPNVSLKAKYKNNQKRDQSLSSSVGISFNSRAGLSALTLSAASSSTDNTVEKMRGKVTGINSDGGSIGGAVSYVNNSYTPQATDGMDSYSGTFNAATGVEFFGAEGQGQITAYFSTQMMRESAKDKTEAVYGYNNTHHATADDVLDFNREKDGNFSVNTTNLPLTNYTYDIYSVQGQGVSGMFRPYRSEVGFVYDNETHGSGTGGSFGVELGGGNAVHGGIDFEVTTSYNQSGDWIDNNLAHENLKSDDNHDYDYEEVYYKNVGDLSVDDESDLFTSNTSLGGVKPIRLKMGGVAYSRTIENTYEIKNPTTPGVFTDATIPAGGIKRDDRVRRNQTIQQITVKEVEDAAAETIDLVGFSAPHADAKDHHTAGFIITRNDGARYVYGKALYNTKKREVTFAAEGLSHDCATGLVSYTDGTDNTIDNNRGDHYFNRVTTPAYAHTYLLTALLSSDYSDLTDNGMTPDDLGSYTKFTYGNPGSVYRWRVPFERQKANYNEGIRTDPEDDKGSYVYGEKEQQYIRRIETKTHVALFYISPRHDAYGVGGEIGSNPATVTTSKMYQLTKISLYSRGEIYDGSGNIVGAGVDACGNTTTTALPIKSVHFEYDYSLCQGVPNNDDLLTDYNCDGVNDVNQGGKLTLKKVYFTYRDSKMGKYSPYEFTYGSGALNPNYDIKKYDVWGNFKESTGSCDVEDPATAAEFPYVDQDDEEGTDESAQAWSLINVGLPSGGNIQVEYESDDYRSVQDMGLMRMFKVAGAGPDAVPGGGFVPSGQTSALLYKTGINAFQAEYLYVKLPETNTATTAPALYEQYLNHIIQNHDQLIQFRFFMNMNKNGGANSGWNDEDFDYVSGYFKLGAGATVFSSGGDDYASIPMDFVDMEGGVGGTQDVNPISKAGWHFARKYLNRYVYGISGVDEGGSAQGIIYQLTGAQMINQLVEIFQGANGVLKNDNIARRFITDKSWIRLMDPSGHKKGGGIRVKQLVMTDEWAQMTSDDGGAPADPDPRDQMYGQVYDYNLPSGISSGIATYEPIGCKENPYVRPIYVDENRLLAPDEENYIEQPFGESFYPSPTVTYSRVSVKNLERIDDGNDRTVKKHATGHVVTEFYTSADYPTMADQTWINVEEDENQLFQSLLNINVKKHITLTQGYVVHLNDMNGKMKSQRVYAEGQTDYISGVDYVYDGFTTTGPGAPDPFTLVSNNTGKLNNKVLALYPNGVVDERVLGVEYDVTNDFREMTTETEIVGVNTNLATFLIGIIPGIIPIPLPDLSHHKDKLNMSSTTKVINSFGVLREIVAHDAGASVSTRNLLWDAITGEVLLTETVNEYGDKYYSFNYPAHWNYSGMGMASRNANIELPFIPHGSVPNGYKIPGGAVSPQTYLHNGDEVILTTMSGPQRAWVHNLNFNYFKLMNENGSFITLSGINGLKVYRSGRRNMQNTSMASVVLMTNPINDMTVTGDYDGNGYVEKKIPADFLEANNHKVINAGAVEFAELWSSQCECGNEIIGNNDNPYLHNTKGVWRAKRSHLYLTGRVTGNPSNPSPRNDGFYAKFAPFYQINTSGNWSIVSTGWTSTSQVTQFNTNGFEIENEDALHRFSAAQYGYNFTFPMAVGANTRYAEIAFDGFEDYDYNGCPENEHFGYRDVLESNENVEVSEEKSHTGKKSLAIEYGETATKVFHLACEEAED